MKRMKKAGLVATSMATIAVCSSLIVGSTYALFTSEDNVNIAVTAGKVSVTAEIVESTLELTSMGVTQDGSNWANGGSAGFSDKQKLDLTYITPGDGATFDIKVTNESNVNIQYRLNWSVEGELADVLEATATGAKIGYWTEWLASDEVKEKTVTVTVTLPEEAGNYYQEKGASISFAIEAVQANGFTVSSEEAFRTALNKIGNGTVTLLQSLSFTEKNPLVIPENSDITIDVAGNTLDIATDGGSKESGITVGAGSKLVLTDSNSNDNSGIHLKNTNDESGVNNEWAPIYVTGTEDSKAELVFENINVSIDNNEYFCSTITANYADVALGENVNIEMTGSLYSKIFLIRNNSTVNIDGAEIYATGAVTPISVGSKGTGSVVNFNSGKIVTIGSSNSQPALEVYPGGTLNLNGGVIEVTGEVKDSATAVAVIGGGVVAMTDGEIVLAPTKGQAVAVMATNNGRWLGDTYSVDGQDLRDYEYYLNAQVTLGGSAKITATTENGGYCYIFGTQASGIESYTYIMDGAEPVSVKSHELKLNQEGDEGYYTITVEESAVITRNGVDCYKGGSGYAYKYNQAGIFGYTDKAIKDERVH